MLFLKFKKGIYLSIWFVTHWVPWFLRGAHVAQGLGVGVFAITRTHGYASYGDSFRVVNTMIYEMQKSYNYIYKK